MKRNLDWQPYYDILARDLPYRERLTEYAAIGHRQMETERFEEFCDRHLADLDQVTLEFFTTDHARDTVRNKVASLFPEHEVDEFTNLFWDRIQSWRRDFAEQHAMQVDS